MHAFVRACMRVRLPRVRCVIPVETYHAEEMHAWGECTRMQHACGREREREREAISTATGKVNEMGEKEREENKRDRRGWAEGARESEKL